MYGQCFLFDIALHSRDLRIRPLSASLRRLSPLSPVLSGCPTALTPFAFLPYGCTAYQQFSLLEGTGSPTLTHCSCTSMIGSPAPQQHQKSRRIDSCCFAFRPHTSVGLLDFSLFRCSMSYPTALLSTLSLQCYHYRPKTRFQ